MDAITSTQAWVNKVIVKYNICPFARREVEAGSIRYIEETNSEVEAVLERLTEEWQHLDQHPETETTLLILSEACTDFDAFLDCVYLANHYLQMNRYEGVYQLAHFHPDYCFEGDPEEAASNYSNRSPYPTLHIIRESSMERAIAAHPDVDAIPERNIEFLNKKGSPFFADLLASCMLSK
ncbi:DUF1415 domain-containing protein [Psychromonas sp. B3M02]|uniref:DUF1415 domain-containing protein n=1 Tax=unclassified Psychromonas TaxID=2614957 RepID=UPI000DE857CA|nr:DUF1415 domain-containing protein [Psychromonas sp. B3M02]RBW47246.1 DUF1415 domain-containing protein [Psychromonas sp. B3M02]